MLSRVRRGAVQWGGAVQGSVCCPGGGGALSGYCSGGVMLWGWVVCCPGGMVLFRGGGAVHNRE